MAAARSYFDGYGWLEDRTNADAYKHESFDLVLRRRGEVKHVEVKGTTQVPKEPPGTGIGVFLTCNEVDHARGQCKAAVKCQSVALFILFGIKITTAPNEPPTAAGGSSLVCDPWNLDSGTLKPAMYRYHVLVEDQAAVAPQTVTNQTRALSHADDPSETVCDGQADSLDPSQPGEGTSGSCTAWLNCVGLKPMSDRQ